MNDFLKRNEDKQATGRKAERKAAKRLNGRLTPGSGAKQGFKGDIVKSAFLVESKATQNASISVSLVWLDKIAKEALDAGKDPALIIQFVDAAGNPWRGSSWVLIPERVFAEITD